LLLVVDSAATIAVATAADIACLVFRLLFFLRMLRLLGQTQ
jgi:hypothetical protein